MESVATDNPNSQPNTAITPTPIAEFAAREDFPQCTLNQFIDIGGYSGTVIDIVHNSIKVRSPEEKTRSFNYHTLKKLYGPREHPTLTQPTTATVSVSAPAEPEPPKRAAIVPDFSQPVKLIKEFTGRTDFPECTLGQHVDVNGYTGVVIDIVNRSLKVRSQEETTRSYNADILRKLHAPSPQAA